MKNYAQKAADDIKVQEEIRAEINPGWQQQFTEHSHYLRFVRPAERKAELEAIRQMRESIGFSK